MIDLMSRTEARLREIYDFDNMEVVITPYTKVYKTSFDDRSFKLLNEFIQLDYHKIMQIKSIHDFNLTVLNNKTSSNINEFKIGFVQDKIAIFWQDMCTLVISKGQILEDTYIEIFYEKFPITKPLTNSDYDRIYEKKLKELKKTIPSDMTSLKFLTLFNNDVKDIINSKITDNSFRYVGTEEFIEKYFNSTSDEINSGAPPYLEFKLNPKNIREALNPFFNNNRMNEIISVISILAFHNKLKNPELNFKEMKGRISPSEHGEKLKEDYSCYYINITPLVETYYNYGPIVITTYKDFISYEKKDTENETLFSYGIQDVSKEIINDISNIFESNLGITRDEIDAKQLSLLLMMNS